MDVTLSRRLCWLREAPGAPAYQSHRPEDRTCHKFVYQKIEQSQWVSGWDPVYQRPPYTPIREKGGPW